MKDGCAGMEKTMKVYEELYPGVKAVREAAKGVKLVRWKWRKFVSLISPFINPTTPTLVPYSNWRLGMWVS